MYIDRELKKEIEYRKKKYIRNQEVLIWNYKAKEKEKEKKPGWYFKDLVKYKKYLREFIWENRYRYKYKASGKKPVKTNINIKAIKQSFTIPENIPEEEILNYFIVDFLIKNPYVLMISNILLDELGAEENETMFGYHNTIVTSPLSPLGTKKLRKGNSIKAALSIINNFIFLGTKITKITLFPVKIFIYLINKLIHSNINVHLGYFLFDENMFANNPWMLPKRTVRNKRFWLDYREAFYAYITIVKSPYDMAEMKTYLKNKELFTSFLKKHAEAFKKFLSKAGHSIESTRETALFLWMIIGLMFLLPSLAALKIYKPDIFSWEEFTVGTLAAISIFFPIILFLQDLRTKFSKFLYPFSYKRTVKKEVSNLAFVDQSTFNFWWKKASKKNEDDLKREFRLDSIAEQHVLLKVLPELQYVKPDSYPESLIESGIEHKILDKKECL